MFMKTLIALLLVSLAQNAVAETVTIDFEAFTSTLTNPLVTSTMRYVEDGYQVTTEDRRLSVLGSVNSVGGSTKIGANRTGLIVTLSRENGLAFDLSSIDIARAYFRTTYEGTDPFNLIFSGVLADGGNISQSFNYTGGLSGIGIQNFVFSNFTNLTQVSWAQSNSFGNVHQFDNIVVKNSGVANVSSVPVSAAAWLFGSGLIGLVGLRRKFNA